jgi:hypothetical protein
MYDVFVSYRVAVMRSTSDCGLHAYEEVDGHTRRYSLGGIPLNSAAIGRLKAYHGEGKIAAEVWVTPELPFILFIALGFLACCLLGI